MFNLGYTLKQGWKNLTYRAQFYLRAKLETKKMVLQNQSVRPVERQLEILLFVLYCLNRIYGFQF